MAQLTTAEAARRLGICEATLNDWRTRNEGPAYTKTGRLVRYPDYEIERWIRDRTIQTSLRSGPQKEARQVGIPLQAARQDLLPVHRYRGRTRKHFRSTGPESGAS
jgi:excisionase family DNA binding protein